MRIYIYILFLFCSLSTSAFSYPIVTDKIEEDLFILPFASWFAEPESAIGITKASAPEMQKNYTPVGKRFGFKEKGAGWLRLEFKKTSPASSLLSPNNTGGLFLKVGALPTGTNSIYYQDNLDPTKTPGIWFATALHAFESRQLPEPPLSGNIVYIHFEETPGPWFTPILEKSIKDPLIFPLNTVLTGLLLCGIIVCLLRAIKDKALWPLWSSFLLGLGLVQVVFPLPLLSRPFELKVLPPLIAPGLCLIVFPHLARIMLCTKDSSPKQDSFLKTLPFLGVIVSLVPLLPEYTWITRLFPLWALLLFPLLPISLGALASKRPSSLIFTGACLLPLLGAVWSLSSLFMEDIHPLAERGGLWGLAIGGIFLFLAGVPKSKKEEHPNEVKEQNEESASASLPEDIFSHPDDTSLSAPPASIFSFEDETAEDKKPENTLAEPTNPPSFPSNSKDASDLVKNSSLEEPKEHHLTLEEATQKYSNTEDLIDKSSFGDKPQTTASSTKALGGMSALFHENDAPSPVLTKNEESLPADIKNTENSTHPEMNETKSSFADNLADSIVNVHEQPITKDKKETAKVISLESEDFSDTEWERQASLMRASIPVGESYIFSLHALIRDVHNTAIPLAEDKDILLSWFISPSLPSFLKGDVVSLRQALSLLVQNAVQATNKGAVQLFVKHAPATTASDLGRLQFTISDTGVAQRADSGFFHAWELAQRTGGFFSIEYSVSGGTLVIFSVKFDIPSEELLQEHLSSLPEENAGNSLVNPHESYSKAFPLTQQMLKNLDIHSPETILEAPFDTTMEADLDPSIPLFIITDMTISNKRLLSHYLSVIPHSVIDPKSIVDVIGIVQKSTPSLIIYDADSPEDMIISSIHAVIEWRKQQGLSVIPQLVIAGHDEQAKRMQKAGATKVLLKPFPQESILEALNEFFPLEQNYLEKHSSELVTKKDLLQKTIFSQEKKQQEEKNSELLTEQKESVQEKMPEHQSLKSNESSTKKSEVNLANSTPFEIVTPEEEVHGTPLLQSLSQEDLQPSASAPNEVQEQSRNPKKPQNTVEKNTTTSQAKPMAVDKNATTPQAKPTAVDKNATTPQAKPTAVDKNATTPQAKPTAVDKNATTPQAKPTAVEKNTTTSQAKPMPEKRATASLNRKEEPKERAEGSTPATASSEKKDLPSATNKEVKVETENAPIQNKKADTNNRPPVEPISLATSERPEEKKLGDAPVSKLEEAGEMLFGTAPTGSYPLPRIEDEAIEIVMLPLIPGLLNTLEDALADSVKARKEHQTIFVQEAVSRLAKKAEVFGLTRLGKIARCVERAAEADDFEAVDILLDDLTTITERYIESLKECYESFLAEAR